MARVVSRSRPGRGSDGSTSVRFTEVVVMAMVVLLIAAGVRYYLEQRKSASYALQTYFGAVKSGKTPEQYALIDDQDKQKNYPTLHDYVQGTHQIAHGYTERVVDVSVDPDPAKSDATETTLNATIDILASGTGKELYQAGSSKGFTDKYFMRKDKEGKWKLVFSRSGDHKDGNLNLFQAEPTPPSTY